MHAPLPTESVQIDAGPGCIELLIDQAAAIRGLALIAHPHPLFGGSNTNKVVHTLARSLSALGQVAIRPNFRGVGHSSGSHDEGEGETADMLEILNWAEARWGKLPLILAGFSFGAYVQSRVALARTAAGTPPEHLIMVGMAAGATAGSGRDYLTPELPKNLPALIVHGEQDETVPLANVFEWARPQERIIHVIPGADHFFHGKLHLIRNEVQDYLGTQAPA